MAAFNPHFGDAALVRVHFIIAIQPGAPEGPGLIELTRALREITRSWSDDLLEEMRMQSHGAAPLGLFAKYERAFDASYIEHTPPKAALGDITILEKIGKSSRAEHVFRPAGAPSHALNIKLYCTGGPMPLSDLIPKIENLGLDVIQEAGYQIRLSADELRWIHDFSTEEKRGRDINVEGVRRNLEETLEAVLSGRTEDDGFNALVVIAGLTWREAWVLRAAAKYTLQTGFPVSLNYIEETLAKHPNIARALITVFHARFNPVGASDLESRTQEVDAATNHVIELLEDVESLDEDRIIRRFLNVFGAIVRTNYYQQTKNGAFKPCISFKIESGKLDEIPEPKPFREIFVSGPRVDGVHLRFGPVARGGLRWSDRREDFRTEVLGLVKAQRVKNAVIVPTGSKGGFYPKQLPADGDRTAVYEEGRSAYKEFISGLLDVTDNIVGGKTVTPNEIVAWDDPDPYLVVAADKGTAAFSDTANEISGEYGFWLGDAFASGGSAGYDHKVMGITARGAWEAVKRHFREMGKDIQTEPFTAAGVGDMSGDVFGNGMLLSKQTRLVAAFDHRDIFIDPDPDPTTSWAERKRLFDTPRTSWQDYDKTILSKGGGVFSRSKKSITLSAEAKKLLGLKAARVTPAELIQAILKMEVELFWFGGIGTYYKAASEENWRVGDRANDGVRVNAEQIRAQVIGEGANLGLTQDARIVFARAGGRINTDAIDNSAGVDSSDHEVNIKILLAAAIEKGELKSSERDQLLKDMTEDVGEYVLQHNYDQTRALTLMVARADQEHDAYARLMSSFEAEDRLDRALEHLPDEKELAALRTQNLWLSRPELSVLIAYAKMKMFDELVDSTAPDDPALERELFGYFPTQLHDFNHSMIQHRLRREIIATRLANEFVDTCGANFAHKVVSATGATYSQIALAYEGARRILQLNEFADTVDALDNKIPAAVQTELYLTASQLITEQVYRILSDVTASETLAKRGVTGLIDLFKEPIQSLKASLPDIVSKPAAAAMEERTIEMVGAGVPKDVAASAGVMPLLEFCFDIVNLSKQTGWTSTAIGTVFFAMGDDFGIEAARRAVRETRPENHFDRLAYRRLGEELSFLQAALARNAASIAPEEPEGASEEWLGDLFSHWRETYDAAVVQSENYIADLELSGAASVGKITLYTRKLSELVDRTKR